MSTLRAAPFGTSSWVQDWLFGCSCDSRSKRIDSPGFLCYNRYSVKTRTIDKEAKGNGKGPRGR